MLAQISWLGCYAKMELGLVRWMEVGLLLTAMVGMVGGPQPVQPRGSDPALLLGHDRRRTHDSRCRLHPVRLQQFPHPLPELHPTCQHWAVRVGGGGRDLPVRPME